jgi:hypothetical protein
MSSIFNSKGQTISDISEFYQSLDQFFTDAKYNDFFEGVKYQGFNREEFIKSALKKMSGEEILKMAIIGGVRGGNAQKILDTPGLENSMKTLLTDGTLITNRKAGKSSELTILRCTAAVPQFVAKALLEAGASKKVPSLDLPACLQFPAAASLPMSAVVRAQHISFAAKFSEVIGGEFNTNIYSAQVQDMLPVKLIPSKILALLGSPTDNDAQQVDVSSMLAKYELLDDDYENVPSGGVPLAEYRAGSSTRVPVQSTRGRRSGMGKGFRS